MTPEVKSPLEALQRAITGRRIAVYGPSGSGKTMVARQAGEQLGLPVIELDALFHQPNWEPTPEEEFRTKVAAELERHPGGRVCDGNYRMVRDIVLPMAETAVWLRLPFPLVYWRLLRRTVARACTKEPLWGKNYESWRLSFLSRDSILLWGITHWRPHIRGIAESLREIRHRANVIVLRSPREVREFLSSLGALQAQTPRPDGGGWATNRGVAPRW